MEQRDKLGYKSGEGQSGRSKCEADEAGGGD